MDYSKFVDSILKQDSRNRIEKTNRIISDLPDQLADFYSLYEPKDVEIVLKDLSAIILYPYKHLDNLQNEYDLKENFFVFATRNGDPIAIYNDNVVTLSHGIKSPDIEVIANSLNTYIDQIMSNMRDR
ncbi:MAG: hypothetical protein ACOCRO_10780 [Halanaerobiales bacterium]